MAKVYDLAVKTGSYTNAQGEEKNRYTNIGAIMEGKDGSQFMMINRHFNPAGVPFKEGSDTIMVSMFAPRDDNQSQQQPRQQQAQRPAPQRNQAPQYDDSVPF